MNGCHGHRGFTLMEAILVIAITGIIAGMVAVFIRAPIDGYVDTVRRAEMADAADTALRRIARDVRLALPNSLRVGGGSSFVEFIPVITGGRYRHDDACFSAAGCTQLRSIGEVIQGHVAPALTGALPAGSQLAIFNQYNNANADCNAAAGIFSVYCSHGIAALTGSASAPSPWVAPAGTDTVFDTFSFANTRFQPVNGSPTRRFFIVTASPVTYACDAGTGTLWRISGYVRQAAQPTDLAAPPLATAAVRARLATGVLCAGAGVPLAFAYAGGAGERAGLLTAWITLQDAASGESVSLMQQVHVDNTP
jgi:MSHA biogenesis protein MshO